jgi:hypothetical protein
MLQHFVDAEILSTPIFCRRQHFVDANILSTRTFCRRQYFVGTNILSPPIFFCRQYFFAANICLCLDFNGGYLLNILLMIVFCVYHDYY